MEGMSAMETKPRKHLIVRVADQRDSWDWDILGPDGTPLEGWHFASIGIDHSGRYALHLIFDEFECVNAEGQPVEVHLTCPTAKHHEELPRLPSAGMHRRPHK
jgi:hypothetical protein